MPKKNEPSMNSTRQVVPDIPFQVQEFEQNRRRHFVGFRPDFHINMTSTTQSWRAIKLKVRYLRSLSLICFKICRLIELCKGISLDFKFFCYGNQIKTIVYYCEKGLTQSWKAIKIESAISQEPFVDLFQNLQANRTLQKNFA